MTPDVHTDHPHRITKPFFTSGTLTLLILMGVGFAFGITRLILGLGSVTNLDDRNPWGIWIAFDVACGVALAAGGFTTAALVDIFGRKKYHALLRPAILTAFLGYLWVAIALLFDLGRYWNIWRPVFHWQGNSVLFEVGMCVLVYLMVLSVEMSPAVLEGLKARMDGQEWGAALLRKVEKPILALYAALKIMLPLFIVAGVVLSCMHQSSLGTLMVIAPTKLSALWHTPMLPILFLLSALCVGFPMVILESIYANSSFGRKPEMELLAPLSKAIPWFLGAYGILKFGDLAFRYQQLNFMEHPAATISLVIEILLGVVAPFLLFLSRAVRRSMGWLLFAVSLTIFGVVLNRLNVFLVGYTAPYATKTYFPSIGEIAMTVAIVSSILFCYRVAVTLFPILPGFAPAAEIQPAPMSEESEAAVNPFWTWVIRGAAIACILAFIGLYSVVHIGAIRASVKTVEEVRRVQSAVAAPVTASGSSYPQRPLAYRNFYLLNSAVLKTKTDDYEPVGFSHRIHDGLAGGDCSVCHHRYTGDEKDRVGTDIKELHSMMELRLSGPCSSCHDDMAKNPPQGCRRCHALPNEADAPARLGLKGAYHRLCIGCHERQSRQAAAPTECSACHHPWTPDHSILVSLAENPTPQDVTKSCLSCHAKAGQDLLKSAHWSWKGNSPALAGLERRADISLKNIVNNYCIAIGSSQQPCMSCHIGYGGVDDRYDFANPANLDCLSCHDTTGTYRKNPQKGGLPDPSVNLVAVSKKVGRPSRQTCGNCHFQSGGAPNAKHGDLEPALAEPNTPIDMHMGTLNMRCQDCHTTRDHRIAGMSITAPAVEGRVQCEKCHGVTPHGVTGALSRHLDDHIKNIACQTCHIPSYARNQPTLLRRDYSTAGQDRPDVRDKYGMPTYDKKFGSLTWGKDLVPTYVWYDGTRKASLAGDTIDASSPVILNAPMGEMRSPAARIYPFKVHSGVQPYDTENGTLALPNLLEDYWTAFDWSKAITEGMKKAGLPYSGKYGFAETRMYSAIQHTVAPALKALGCADCHSTDAVACARCHRDAPGTALPAHRLPVYPQVKNRMDFKALGYAGDPARAGGRFAIAIGRGSPSK
jgi:octaheme c-type cytochrome (tetrathionate reductase family)